LGFTSKDWPAKESTPLPLLGRVTLISALQTHSYFSSPALKELLPPYRLQKPSGASSTLFPFPTGSPFPWPNLSFNLLGLVPRQCDVFSHFPLGHLAGFRTPASYWAFDTNLAPKPGSLTWNRPPITGPSEPSRAGPKPARPWAQN